MPSKLTVLDQNGGPSPVKFPNRTHIHPQFIVIVFKGSLMMPKRQKYVIFFAMANTLNFFTKPYLEISIYTAKL